MTPVDAGEVTQEIVIGAPPDTVFPYFTDPERMVRWMGTEADIDARPGGAYRILVGGSPPYMPRLAIVASGGDSGPDHGPGQ